MTITKEAKGHRLHWKVGDSEYEGEDTLDGNLLTTTPIAYALADDGSLTGTLGQRARRGDADARAVRG